MPETLQLLMDRLETPLGELWIVADRAGNLRAVNWPDEESNHEGRHASESRARS